jgi:uncharacterized RDD family membrane protein YckC
MLDDELLIETPERVELHYVLANIGNRFLAAALDHIFQVLLMLALLLLVGAVSNWNFDIGLGTWAAAVAVLVFFLIYWGYFVIFETLWNGQTPGKRIMKLRVVREDGRPIRFFEAFVRNLLRIAIDFMPLPSYAIGVASIIFSPRSKRIGDLVAGTVVVKERASEAPTLDDIIRLSEAEERKLARTAPAPFKANTRLLSDRELQAVETFLNRRYELNEPNRAMLAARIAQGVAGKLGIPNLQISPETVLEEIERQHRVQSRYLD